MQDINLKQLKLEVQDTYKKNEKKTTNFEAVNNEDVMNEACLDEKLSKMQGQTSHIEKGYNEYRIHIKQDLLIERAIETTI